MPGRDVAGAGGDFFAELRRYAFFPDLGDAVAARGQDLEALIARRDGPAILRFILTDEGLGYGRLPKALLLARGYEQFAFFYNNGSPPPATDRGVRCDIRKI